MGWTREFQVRIIAKTKRITSDVIKTMAETLLGQQEADALLELPKFPENNEKFDFPGLGGKISIPLVSRDRRESFSLDIRRKRISLSVTYQTRSRQVFVLARLDFGAPHQNPDETIVASPHLHLYREGFGDKWAYALPEGMLSDPNDVWQVLLDFAKYCHIDQFPNIDHGLFAI